MSNAFYEPAVPLRFEIREREAWEGDRRIVTTYRILQFWIDGIGWIDVPEVRAEP